MGLSIAGATGDPLPAPALTEGQWQSIDADHRLIYLGNGTVLDWVRHTGAYRVWKVDRAALGGADPLPGPAVSQGTWATVNSGHELIYLGDDRLLDWQPAQKRFRVWLINRAAIGNADPLPGVPQTEGIWANIGTKHQLISLGGNRVLDWEPETGDYHIWHHDPAAVGAADPLPAPALTQGRWESIRSGHRLIPVGEDRVLDWVPATGDFRVWRYDRSAIGDPFPGDPEVTGKWETIRLGHEIVYLDGDRILDWEPATKHFRMWRYDRNITTLRRSTLRLHLKIIAEPPFISLDLMVANAKALYASYGIEVIEVSRENVDADAGASFATLYIGECRQSEGPTTDVIELFNSFRTNVRSKDIVVYFVRTLAPATAGCATHPPDKPGAVVSAKLANEWTLAHEIGHVLGLALNGHPDDTNLLMHTGTARTNLPPDLTADEIATIIKSELTQE